MNRSYLGDADRLLISRLPGTYQECRGSRPRDIAAGPLDQWRLLKRKQRVFRHSRVRLSSQWFLHRDWLACAGASVNVKSPSVAK